MNLSLNQLLKKVTSESPKNQEMEAGHKKKQVLTKQRLTFILVMIRETMLQLMQLLSNNQLMRLMARQEILENAL